MITLYFAERCTTETYFKSDGSCACGFYLGYLPWHEAINECLGKGARLPEITSQQENDDIFRVSALQYNMWQILSTKLITKGRSLGLKHKVIRVWGYWIKQRLTHEGRGLKCSEKFTHNILISLYASFITAGWVEERGRESSNEKPGLWKLWNKMPTEVVTYYFYAKISLIVFNWGSCT